MTFNDKLFIPCSVLLEGKRGWLLSLVQNNVVSKKHLVVHKYIILKIHSVKEVLRLRVKFPKTFFSVKVSEKQDCPYFLMQ